MSHVDDLLRNAERYANVFTAGELPVQPALRLAIVTCMDSRIDLFALLGLHLGEAHVIRNAGGLITEDVVRSLTLSQALLGTRDVMVVQHTGCGLHGDEDELRERVASVTGAEPPAMLGAFADIEASVVRQLETLRAAPGLTGAAAARGFVYEVETGRLREVR
ncbi:MAG: carbonic anhydrase [Solirubrobacteraceae bacterium]